MITWTKGFRIYLFVSFVLLLLQSLEPILTPRILGRIVDIGIVRKDYSFVLMNSFLLLGLIILRFISSSITNYLLQAKGIEIITRIRDMVQRKIFNLPLKFWEKNPSGKIAVRLSHDVNTILEIYTSVLIYFAKDFVILLATLIFIFKISPISGFVVVLFVIGEGFISFIFGKKMKNASWFVRYHLAVLSAFSKDLSKKPNLIPDFSGIRREFLKRQENLYLSHMKYIISFSLFRPTAEFSQVLSIASILIISKYISLSPGDIISIIGWIRVIFTPVVDLAERYSILQSAISAVQNIKEILSQEEEDRWKVERRKGENIRKVEGEVFGDGNICSCGVFLNGIPKRFSGYIRFQNVSFKYDNIYIIKNFNLEIFPGDKVLITGRSGIGKTTLMNLLVCFYDFEGEIFIDEFEIRKIPLKHLRERVRYIVQEAGPEIAEIKGWRIWETQTQLIEKAIKSDFDILILDESLSSLDEEKEKQMIKIIEECPKTTIIISHLKYDKFKRIEII